ncbi:hypothetical protein CP04DC42_0839 [Chlamydia psittaci 04DC42]|nr:hypothetical protein B598_0435 [Chlamydia psittaci GR9]AFS21534.1 hypothetical protein B599_0431 [Chlamydia psittaci MN]AFS22621.1 hypothetical protein B600_0461 [Chlamydia psittaci VS225]AFS23575.1 hypothetical protein B601_0435 [Chlamydia psittaci WS/RT/E30]AFS26405.1 hypothetical protein B603_0438 [Chlamydia psittaci WC]EPJ13224.1 hypothetical protein CP02DC16_0847 [Chlamydia psittaci 02DC16]EPJ14860.1 hypothetical protein CP02DC15_0134 [Chlamydia psittaci 02DC15]EPJ16835.1 hypothetica
MKEGREFFKQKYPKFHRMRDAIWNSLMTKKRTQKGVWVH